VGASRAHGPDPVGRTAGDDFQQRRIQRGLVDRQPERRGSRALNKTGTTQLRVYFNLGDNDDLGNDYLGYYSGENATAANRPQLVVTYQ
jgi:hypothetical protein